MTITFTPSAAISDISFGINLLNGSVQTDVVGVYDQETMQQIFTNARPMRCTVRESSRIMDYPVESGAILSDYKVINPVSIDMTMILSSDYYSEDYQQMRNAALASTKLSIQTRVGVYSDMIIVDIGDIEDAEMYDSVGLSVRFRQVQIVIPSISGQPSNYAPINPQLSDTVGRGFQLASALTNQTSSALSYIHAASVFGARF